jgi:hypothetical protein
MTPILQDVSWDRMIAAVEAVRERLLRAAGALEFAGISYAVCGGNAVGAWVSRVDPAAVRNTPDVDILIRRADFLDVKVAWKAAGFEYRVVAGTDHFKESARLKPRDAIRVLFAEEKVRSEDHLPSPSVDDTVQMGDYRVVSFEGLLRMEFNAYRLKNCVHLRDLIEVGLLDETWLPKLIPEHAAKLQELLNNPDG